MFLAPEGQNQITDASHLFVFCNYSVVKDEHIDDYITLKANIEGKTVDDIKGYGDFIKGKLVNQTEDEKNNWTIRQTYLALGNLLSACAELKIDTCPMEGFEVKKYNDILELSERGLNASVIVTIGYRSSKDLTQNTKKVRRPFKTLFELK